LRGIDTPEIRSSCADETILAVQARDHLKALIGNKTITLHNVHYGKYAGRVIADVYVDTNISLSTMMKEYGFAVTYTGGKRPLWC
jgi:endonuclease YncB( thermonuclease family)